MPIFDKELVFIVPTKNRLENLNRLLSSIQKQKVRPKQIIVINDAKVFNKSILSEFTDLKIRYVIKDGCSLTKARNIGLSMVDSSVNFVGFLDDDIVLEDNSLKVMQEFFEKTTNTVAGASFNIIGSAPQRRRVFGWIKRFFQLYSWQVGEVLPSGFQTSLFPVGEDTRVEWLLGGATIWRKGVFDQFKFDEWFTGYSFVEDLDFSYRVGRKYKLLVVAKARVQHLTSLANEIKNYHYGKYQIINRFYFVGKHIHLSKILFFWAAIGQVFENLAVAIEQKQCCYIQRAMGNLVGIVCLIFKSRERVNEHIKV